MPDSRSRASRLNHLLFEVMAVASPQVAYSFVTNNLPTLHTFDRAGHSAGTRRATKSQLSRCSYLSENAPIRAECFRNLSYPFLAWGSWRSRAASCEAARRDTGCQAGRRMARGGWCLGIRPHGIRGPLAKTGANPPGKPSSNRYNGALLAPGRRDPG